MNEVFENIATRRSVRSFLNRPIDREALMKLAQMGAWAPSGMNRQNCQFTVLLNKRRISELAEAVGSAIGSPDYDFYKPAALILVSSTAAYNSPLDCACALENIFLAAHSMGIGSVWINQLKDAEKDEKVAALLASYGLPPGHRVYGAAALGYPAEIPPAPERKSVIRFVE